VPLHPIIISIFFHHYKEELLECIRKVEKIEAKINNHERKGKEKEKLNSQITSIRKFLIVFFVIWDTSVCNHVNLKKNY
jgi:hypothetical protein